MTGDLLFKPDASFIRETQLTAFSNWLNQKTGLSFENYASLHSWSINAQQEFWTYLLEYFDVMSTDNFETVLKGQMPECSWFEGLKLNYAEHLERNANKNGPALVYFSENNPTIKSISHQEFFEEAKAIACFLNECGLQSGDVVAGYLPNLPETHTSCHAALSQGFIWSCCSPDFGVDAVIDRFSQIKPKVIFVSTGYKYGGKIFDRFLEVKQIISRLPDLICVIEIPYVFPSGRIEGSTDYHQILTTKTSDFEYKRLDFNHPMWVLYSSGTTGKPKAITHRHGGMLLEHLKYLVLQNDVRPGEKFFWYSTTGWMMWNFCFASMLAGACVVVYEGSPAAEGISFLWKKASEIGIHHFGTSAPFLIACMKNGINMENLGIKLEALRTIGSTASPLPTEAFEYVYENIKSDIFLCSMSGGTDICSAFVGSNMWSPVHAGYIQCAALGVDVRAIDDAGKPVINQVGEMYICQALPNMPVYFWNDTDFTRYKASYFEGQDIGWRHGDWIEINAAGEIMILGRSDATLNRNGIRIGTAEVYNALNEIPTIRESLIVNIEKKDGSSWMPLFVVLASGSTLDEDLKKQIRDVLKTNCSPRHVPDTIIAVSDVPFTISGKKMETPVKKLLMGYPADKAYTADAMRNPEIMAEFEQYISLA